MKAKINSAFNGTAVNVTPNILTNTVTVTPTNASYLMKILTDSDIATGMAGVTVTVNDGAWGGIGGGGPALGLNSIIRTNANTISENITIPLNTNGMSAGEITIADGYTVTVNGTWSII